MGKKSQGSFLHPWRLKDFYRCDLTDSQQPPLKAWCRAGRGRVKVEKEGEAGQKMEDLPQIQASVTGRLRSVRFLLKYLSSHRGSPAAPSHNTDGWAPSSGLLLP